jgi:hypothetical protein
MPLPPGWDDATAIDLGPWKEDTDMGATLDRLRSEMKVRALPHSRELTITVKAYDNGMVEVDGHPNNRNPDYDAAEGWLNAAEIVIQTLNEFRRQVEAR